MLTRDSREMLLMISGRKTGRVLDMGCGSGYIGRNLVNKGFIVESADIDKALIKDNKRKFSGLKNLKFYCSDLFSAFPKKKYDIISFDIPFFPEKKSSAMKFLGFFTKLFHTEKIALPTARKIFPEKAVARRAFIEKFMEEAENHLNPSGLIFINLFSDEMEIVKKHFRIRGRKKLFKNYFIIYASKKGNHQN